MPATQVIYLTSGTSWTVPAEFNTTNNTIEAIGGAGGGGGGGGSLLIDGNGKGAGGGGAGAYAILVNFDPGVASSINYVIGAGGAGGTGGIGGFGGDGTDGTAGTDTTFNVTSVVAKGGSLGSLGGGGTAGSNGTGGAGGVARSCTPTTDAASGGSGANGSSLSGGGAGGGGGPSGAGSNGSGTSGGAGAVDSWTSVPGGVGASPGDGGNQSTDGVIYGGAGGGGAGGALLPFFDAGADGGDGAGGIIIITYAPEIAMDSWFDNLDTPPDPRLSLTSATQQTVIYEPDVAAIILAALVPVSFKGWFKPLSEPQRFPLKLDPYNQLTFAVTLRALIRRALFLAADHEGTVELHGVNQQRSEIAASVKK